MPDFSVFDDKEFCQKVEQAILANIEEACLEIYPISDRTYLGGSQIGDGCSRKLWYDFRWVKKFSSVNKNIDSTSRILRLFNRGHIDEERVVLWLKEAGFDISEGEVKPDGEIWQHEKTAIEDHFKCHIDGIVRFPDKYEIEDHLLLEVKTFKQDKKWSSLFSDGVRRTEEKYYFQMCVYGYLFGFNYALFIAVNKNNDEIYTEIVKLSSNLGKELLEKAASVIFSPPDSPPPKIAQNPAFFKCSYCNYKEICYYDGELEKNCRSCKFAMPDKAGKWYCNHWQQTIPGVKEIKAGCPEWKPLQ